MLSGVVGSMLQEGSIRTSRGSGCGSDEVIRGDKLGRGVDCRRAGDFCRGEVCIQRQAGRNWVRAQGLRRAHIGIRLLLRLVGIAVCRSEAKARRARRQMSLALERQRRGTDAAGAGGNVLALTALQEDTTRSKQEDDQAANGDAYDCGGGERDATARVGIR